MQVGIVASFLVAVSNICPTYAFPRPKRWLPDGQVEGQEYVARNPLRADRHRGSFKVNLRTGRWADFATGDRGGDPVSLAAYLFGLSQTEAARRLAGTVGLTDARAGRG
jgi:hypothetical protein